VKLGGQQSPRRLFFLLLAMKPRRPVESISFVLDSKQELKAAFMP
jgi:hypothetical protein